MFKDKTILIVGGSGSWGQELTRQLLSREPKQIIIFSRGEILQIGMQRKFNNKLVRYIIGDVRDRRAVDDVVSGVDYIFHLAALKHVPTCENQVFEAIQTNILGANNIIEAAIKYKVKKFIDVSTDKAVDPINTYGLTKAIGEKLTIQANCLTNDTEFICIRSGNVLGTNGSVVPFIIDQIRTTNVAKVMDEDMTRFFITFQQAIKLLLYAAEMGIGGETYVMNMPSFYIKDLVGLLVEFYGNEKTKIEVMGAREGEKTHEVLISPHEIYRTRYVNDNYYVIYPQLKTGRTYYHYWDDPDVYMKPPIPEYGLSSADNLKDKDFLRRLLKEGGWNGK
jgi:UDP-N-acetylglucosamine 4,6-dehydratase